METLVEIRAVVRRPMLDRVVCALKEAGVPRLTVTNVHAIGAGVDPASTQISWDEGSRYADKAVVQFVCGHGECQDMADLISRVARTGRRGDGIVIVSPVLDVIKIRTGRRGLDALA